MRYFLDTEFNGFGGELLSLALVREDGHSIYLCIPDAPKPLNRWVAEHVWPLVHIRLPVGRTVAFREDFGHLIKDFLGRDNHPVIVTDWPDDIRYFCEILITGPGTMIPTAKHMTFTMVRTNAYPTDLEGAVQHNAWWDAMALRAHITGR